MPTSLCHCFMVKVKGRGQDQRSMSNFWHAAVNIRGSAVPSAARKNHFQSEVFVCVSNNGTDAVDRLLVQDINKCETNVEIKKKIFFLGM